MLSSQDRLVRLENLLERLQRNRQQRSQRPGTEALAETTSPGVESFETIEHEAAAMAESSDVTAQKSSFSEQATPIDLIPKGSVPPPAAGLTETSGAEQIIDENSRIISAKSGNEVIVETDEFAGAPVDEILSVAPRDVAGPAYSEIPEEEEEIMELDSDDLMEESDEEVTDIVPTLQPPPAAQPVFEGHEDAMESSAAEEAQIPRRPSIDGAGTEFDIAASTSTDEPLPLIETVAETDEESSLSLDEEAVATVDEEELELVEDEEFETADNDALELVEDEEFETADNDALELVEDEEFETAADDALELVEDEEFETADEESPLPLDEEAVATVDEDELELVEDEEIEAKTLPSPDILHMSEDEHLEQQTIPSPAVAQSVSVQTPMATTEPEPTPRLYQPNVTASGSVASINGAPQKQREWTIDAVLDRAWKVGS